MARKANLLGALLMLVAVACGPRTPQTTSRTSDVAPPKLRVLGIAQDAGVPQPGCFEARCVAAANGEGARMVASLALDDGAGHVYVFDATPDFPRQLGLLDGMGDTRAEPGGRTRRPIDGVFLTHAHMGHYLGLAHLGFESAHGDRIPVWGTARMGEFLQSNAPWDQLVRLDEIELQPLVAGSPIELGKVRVVPISVPHRGEYTDTVAFRIEGPKRTALYVPDIDPWHRQEPSDVDALFEGVDLALVDGTFFSRDELPGRDIEQIGHPLMLDTVALLAARVANGMELRFIHLNHTNPALDQHGEARRSIESHGASICERGEDFGL